MNAKQRRKADRQRRRQEQDALPPGHSFTQESATAATQVDRAPVTPVPVAIANASSGSERFVKVGEIADRLEVTPRTLRNWERRGLICLRRIGLGGRLVGMMESEFQRWLYESLQHEQGAK